ncbi:DNA polymerase Y family protein [Paracoccaceae bacterium Fryx2]|nr:DNA polymerase Y family protein [Paracoccaceae bacterium Fryx2]
MAHRRILSLWFPRLAAERLLRQRGDVLPLPFAVVAERGGAQVLASLNPEAEAAGLALGQPLRDATAMCPGLLTRPADPLRDAAFLTVLRRWAGKFSPWVAEEPPAALVVDLTGCAHLFGGEAALLAEVEADCAGLGLTVRAGIADTPGAAWALARFAGQGVVPLRNGDAIEQEARATRSRAAKRRGWERGGVAPVAAVEGPQGVIAAPGQMRQALAGLPITALRLPPETVAALARLGLRQIDDITGLPRAALARRFGTQTLRRLDQALGLEPEPVAPARAPLHFAVRLTFPDPIGLLADVQAGVDRLLPVLCARLREKARGARRVRLQAFCSDGRCEVVEVGLARPADDPDRIRPLLALKLEMIDAGFGIDCLRLSAVETEPLSAVQHRGHIDAAEQAAARQGSDTALEDLLGKLGARLGMDAVTRLHPAESHIPEKSAIVLAAAWSSPAPAPWPRPRAPRPLLLFRPEPVAAPGVPQLPTGFRWRRRDLVVRVATGPERLAPEWWLDDPEWRSGLRDYWRVEATGGERLWLFYAHGGEVSGGWFCQGVFA